MVARILSTLIFWLLMTVLIAGALVTVPLLYLPFVALKAVYLAVTGKLSQTTGDTPPQQQGESPVIRPH